MNGRVLVAGFATRHVAQSAFRAGYRVCAVDHFCDQDLDWYTEDRVRFEDLADLTEAVADICSRHRFDILVVTSGAEDLQSGVPLCGTPPETVRRFLDKRAIQQFFEDLDIPVPGLLAEHEYPAFLKPCRGAGGWRNAVIHDDTERIFWETKNPEVPYIRQRVVPGIPASVCCITDGHSARAIAANEQILRGKGEAEFGFAGSVTPCSHGRTRTMVAMAERIAAASGCRGTVGIDFILGDGVHAIEINPRFQATVETVEASTGCNMFRLHTEACNGVLPPSVSAAGRYAARKILFAEDDMTIRADLKRLSPMIADIPWPGTELEAGMAVTSVYGQGLTRAEALGSLDKNITTVQQYLR